MGTVMPQNELLRKAVAWILEMKKDTGKPVDELVQEASVRFNLGPKDEESLKRCLAENECRD